MNPVATLLLRPLLGVANPFPCFCVGCIMILLAHLTEVEFPALAIAYGAGIATGAFSAMVLFRWRTRR